MINRRSFVVSFVVVVLVVSSVYLFPQGAASFNGLQLVISSPKPIPSIITCNRRGHTVPAR